MSKSRRARYYLGRVVKGGILDAEKFIKALHKSASILKANYSWTITGSLGARSILLHFWSSRDFAQVLGYTDYRNFEAVIEKRVPRVLTAAGASRIITLKSPT